MAPETDPQVISRPTPHGAKLRELLTNTKLPPSDVARVSETIVKYESWISSMQSLESTGDDRVAELVALLNSYKKYIELNLIWDSADDFLFRQRGQIKLDNSIIEEFLPYLVDGQIIPELDRFSIFAGPASAFASTYFGSTLTSPSLLPNLSVRTKDQDFTLSRPAFLAASFDNNFPTGATDIKQISLAYVAAECKTNLDETMFQEATATAHDLKIALPASRYFLMCEYLDMTPISTSGTDITEVLILRGKRMSSNVRKDFSNYESRIAKRTDFENFLDTNPIRPAIILRFVEHLRSVFSHQDPDEDDAISRGYF